MPNLANIQKQCRRLTKLGEQIDYLKKEIDALKDKQVKIINRYLPASMRYWTRSFNTHDDIRSTRFYRRMVPPLTNTELELLVVLSQARTKDKSLSWKKVKERTCIRRRDWLSGLRRRAMTRSSLVDIRRFWLSMETYLGRPSWTTPTRA